MSRITKTFLYLFLMITLAALTGCDDSDSDSSDQGGNLLLSPFVQVPPAKVETTRDDKGVWYITGPDNASLYDIFEAMGYAVATDRLWQLEQFRRVGSGRLSEILGKTQSKEDDILAIDKEHRILGYSDSEVDTFYNELDDESKAMVDGYLDGINRRVEEVRTPGNKIPYPYEFVVINFQKILAGDFTPILTDWTLEDLFGWITVLQRNFDGEAMSQMDINNAALYNDLQERFPDDYQAMFDDLRWIDDPDALTYVPGTGGAPSPKLKGSDHPLSALKTRTVPDLRQVAAKMAERRNNVIDSLKSINAYVKMGSYGWVVSGDKTESGNPILYSGPQMGLDLPSIVIEGSIRAGGMNISGMTVPGMPGLIISRTPHQAFAMMTGHVNSVDYYIEKPEDVEFHRTEIIKILGGEEEELDIYRSKHGHGPVIQPMPYNPATYDPDIDGPIITWKYSHWGHVTDSTQAFLKFVRAESIEEFAEAMEYFPASFHVLYADRNGNIAYWMTGRDPVRPVGEWRLPQGFLAPHLEWDSDVLIDRSTDRNTSQGFYGGWNNRSRAGYAAPYGPFHRAHVVNEYLSTHNNLTFDDVRNLALRIASTESFGGGGNPWKFVESHFTAVVNADPTTDRLAALDILAAWDGHFVDGGEAAWADGPDRADGWILMDKWIREVIRLTFEDELLEVKDHYTLFNVLLHALPGTTLNNNYNWFQNLSDAGAPQTSDAIILAALDTVLVDLGSRSWGTNKRGEHIFKHPLLVLTGSTEVRRIPRSSRSTYAQCVEYDSSGPIRIESMFPLGQSGFISTGFLGIFSPIYDEHFFSMTDAYDNFDHRPFPLFD